MIDIKLADDFFPGISIYRSLRQSPNSVLNRYAELLQARGFAPTNANISLLLDTSKELYAFVMLDGKRELNQYEREAKDSGKPIRGGFFPPFELVFQILTQVLDYAQKHPKDALESAASLAVLADYVEKRAGKPGAAIIRKLSRTSSKIKRQLSRLSRVRRTRKPRKRKTSKPKSRQGKKRRDKTSR